MYDMVHDSAHAAGRREDERHVAVTRCTQGGTPLAFPFTVQCVEAMITHSMTCTGFAGQVNDATQEKENFIGMRGVIINFARYKGLHAVFFQLLATFC